MTCKEIADRLHELAEERGYKPYEVWKRCQNKVAQQTVYNAFEGKPIRLDTFSYICKALEVSEFDFFNTGDTGKHLTKDEDEVIEIIRKLDELQYNRMLGYLRSLEDSTK